VQRAIFVSIVAVLTLSSCVAMRAPNTPDHEAPRDFVISLTVLGASGADDASSSGTRTQPAWFVLEPDGTLRARRGARSVLSSVPPRVRTLNREQREHTWTLARAAGAGEAGLVVGAVGDEDQALRAGHPDGAIVLFWQANGARATSVSPMVDEASPRHRALHELLRSLRDLAWLHAEQSEASPG
jgi:hypothetical protein